jgi:hypothetical protein
MVQAAARGVIDFSEADTRDRHWWRRTYWLLNQLETDNTDHICQLRLKQHLTVTEYGLAKEAFDTHWKAANDLIANMMKRRFPWETFQADAAADHLRDAYVNRFGDPNDPEVIARQEAEMKEIRATNREKLAAAEPTRFGAARRNRARITRLKD